MTIGKLGRPSSQSIQGVTVNSAVNELAQTGEALDDFGVLDQVSDTAGARKTESKTQRFMAR